MNIQQLIKPNQRWMLSLIAGGVLLTGSIVYYSIQQFHQASKPLPTQPTIAQPITALGRLEPEQEVINVSVPAALNNDRIVQLRVKRGDRVEAGQMIAVMDSRDRLQTALLEAQEQVRVAQSKLTQVQSGAKPEEVVGDNGIVELGQTDQMEVVAKVYQSDIGNVRRGQTTIVMCTVSGGVALRKLQSADPADVF